MSNLPQKDHTPPSTNLPGYQAKINLLRQIDDAASQYGGASRAGSGLNMGTNKISQMKEGRNQGALRTGNMIMGGNHNV